MENSANSVALREVNEKIMDVETRMKPLRRISASIQIPEVELADQEIGRKTEQIRQWERVRSLLDLQADLVQKISAVESQEKLLQADISVAESNVPFEEAAETFSMYMNTFLNQIHQSKTSRWSKDNRVATRFTDKRFYFRINSSDWKSALGGTWKGYLLLAYNYALLSFSDTRKYPGFLMLDYPKSFEGSAADPNENANHTIKPFINLTAGLPATQVIVAGKGFSRMEGVNFIHFDKQWGCGMKMFFASTQSAALWFSNS